MSWFTKVFQGGLFSRAEYVMFAFIVCIAVLVIILGPAVVAYLVLTEVFGLGDDKGLALAVVVLVLTLLHVLKNWHNKSG